MTTTIKLTDEFTKAALARAVPGAEWDKDVRSWIIDNPSPRTAAVVLRLFPTLARDYPLLTALRDELASDVRPFDNATPFNRPLQGSTAATLYDFQALDLGYMREVLLEHGGGYIGWERGLGKTLGTCELMAATGSQRTLVVCPNTAKVSVWRDEVERWLPGHDVVVLPNEKAKRERVLESLAGSPQKARSRASTGSASGHGAAGDSSTRPLVLVVHYEALALIAGKMAVYRRPGDKWKPVPEGHERDPDKYDYKVMLGDGWKAYGEWDLFVADEAHRLKNTAAQQTKAAKKVPAKMRLALSGSIIENHAEEMFSLLQWLFPKTYKSKWRDWNDRFLDYAEGGYGKICLGVKAHKIEDMRRELGVFMVYRRKQDELDLPAKTIQTMYVDLSATQRKLYKELEETCLAQLEDGTVVAATDGLVMLGKLRQIASGLDLISDKVTDSTKLDLAADLIADADEPTVAFSWYKGGVYGLAERLKAKNIEAFVVTGDTPHAARAEMIARFQAGECKAFLGTLSTLSESVNLFRAANVIRIDRSWNPAQNLQAEDRVHRHGQCNPVTVVDIIARDTVDEYRVLPALANKEALRRMILGGSD